MAARVEALSRARVVTVLPSTVVFADLHSHRLQSELNFSKKTTIRNWAEQSIYQWFHSPIVHNDLPMIYQWFHSPIVNKFDCTWQYGKPKR